MCAMPTTTVVKTIGAISILTSLMKPSPSGFIAAPYSGATKPRTAPDHDGDQDLEVERERPASPGAGALTVGVRGKGRLRRERRAPRGRAGCAGRGMRQITHLCNLPRRAARRAAIPASRRRAAFPRAKRAAFPRAVRRAACQQLTQRWLFFAPRLSSSATVSGNGCTRCTGPLAISTVVWPLRLTAFTSAPFETR